MMQEIIKIVRKSKSEEEAFQKVKNVRGIPAKEAQAFSDKYNPGGRLTARQAFAKFYKDVQNDTGII
jgi:hypothetical protein